MMERQTILYLDDDEQCLDVFRSTFGAEYEVFTASSAAEARRMLSEQPAQIVISDQAMPDVDGITFLNQIAVAYPQSRRILLTGSMMLGETFGAVGAGLVDIFIRKPWAAADIRGALERVGL